MNYRMLLAVVYLICGTVTTFATSFWDSSNVVGWIISGVLLSVGFVFFELAIRQAEQKRRGR